MRWLAPLTASGVGLVYLVAYLATIGDLGFAAQGWQVRIAANWASLWLDPRGLFRFEGIAILDAGLMRLIISPLNLAIGIALTGLLAANIDGAIRLRQQPPACRAHGASVGALAALPALLAGGACCAPALVILLGLPGVGAIVGLFGWLVPIAFIALTATRWWQRRLGAPPVLSQIRTEGAGSRRWHPDPEHSSHRGRLLP